NQPVLAYGKGDEFEPTDLNLKGCYIVLVYPTVAVSTKEAYADVTPMEPMFRLKDILKQDISHWKNILVNDFEKSVFNNYPVLATIKQQLYNAGAKYACMSGSGSCIFSIFDKPVELPFPKEYRVWKGKLL